MQKKKSTLTIYDLASELNVSAATVSRALRNDPSISAAMTKKIFELAKKKGYQSNNFASNLRKQTTNTIGVIVHELESRFIISVLAGIEKVVRTAGYDMLIAHSGETFSQEVANANNFFHKRVDGLITSLAYTTRNTAHYNPFFDRGIPVVFFDRVDEKANATKIVIDNYKAGFNATYHLAEQGCKRIAHVTGNLQRNVYSERFRGYKAALKKARVPYNKNLVLVNELAEKDGLDAANWLLNLSPLPDGVFITKDICASVCMSSLQEAGIQVPEQIAIVGFNNTLVSRLMRPQLTTINYPGTMMGEIAAKNLLEQLTPGHTAGTNTVILNSELIVRGSSLKKS